ncbi:MAG: hypothetical protein U9Q12_03080 [Patescibacteria group bacterium]|nr:hypothetical protein [Patescibacteria group bacterium]
MNEEKVNLRKSCDNENDDNLLTPRQVMEGITIILDYPYSDDDEYTVHSI